MAGKLISELRGVGPRRTAAFGRLGIADTEDLLEHYPRTYEDRGNVRPLSYYEDGEKGAVLLTVATAPRSALLRRGMEILKFRALDDSGSCEITYFNQPYLKTAFELGKVYRFWGRIEKRGGRYAMVSPTHEEAREGVILPPLVPVYTTTEGLSQKLLRDTVRECLRDPVEDFLPPEIRREGNFLPRGAALLGIHAPDSFEMLAAAKRRLVYDDLFLFALSLRRMGQSEALHGAPVLADTDVSPLLSLLPYTLTGAQQKVIADISHDVSSDVPMNRLLVGDVGCGKTVCAAAALYLGVKNGYQTALMAPTEILARQHFADLEPLFSQLGIRVTLLVGSLTETQKKAARSAALSGKSDILIGTQALISSGVGFARLGLCVVDEQHRFGVEQRAALSGGGAPPHFLSMTATPIPRTLALTVYGHLHISKIDELPPGRQVVDTYLVNESYRERLDAFIRKQVEAGGQVYIVCPAVEDAPADEGDLSLWEVDEAGAARREGRTPLKSAVTYRKELAERLCDIPVALVHGRMKGKEKDEVMQAFSSGQIKVLVSTTVIEVGVNVPAACLMIVENAERFGLSQLHQLRGRVGRGERKSYCVLVSDARGESARTRLSTLCRTHDGFEIAETDLRLRGPGDFLRRGEDFRQSGTLDFPAADLCRDGDLLKKAFDDADRLLTSDKTLSLYPALRARLARLAADAASTMN